MRKKLFVSAFASALVLVAVPVALAAFSQTAEVRLTSASGKALKKTGTSTGTKAELAARDPDAPGGKPKVATRVVVRLPTGTHYDPRGAAQCNGRTDQEYLTPGECPKSTLIGTGTAKANAFPLIPSTTEDIKAYHAKGEVVFVLTDNGADPAPGQSLVIHSKLSRKGVLTTDVPPLVLPTNPPTKVALTDFSVTIKPKSKTLTARASQRRRKKKVTVPLLRSPKKCTGKWTTTVDFTYDDGSTLKGIKTTQPCTKPKKRRK